MDYLAVVKYSFVDAIKCNFIICRWWNWSGVWGHASNV